MENPKFVIYKGKRYWVSGSGKYFYYKRNDEIIALHRQVWIDANSKEIPDGFDIHHIDGNTFNNEPSNLECVDGGQHMAKHMRERWKNNRELYYANILRAGEKAKEWHRSDEGRLWHSKNGKASWNGRKKKTFNCKYCQNSYLSFRAGYCSNSCLQKDYYKTGKYHEKRDCILCGLSFMVRKNESTKSCSFSCAAKMRFRNRVLPNVGKR